MADKNKTENGDCTTVSPYADFVNSPPSRKSLEDQFGEICTDTGDLAGRWQLLKDRSESFEEIMTVLGIGWVKRKAMSTATPINEISLIYDDSNTKILNVHIFCTLPMGITKKVDNFLDREEFQNVDGDTGSWSVRCQITSEACLVSIRRRTDDILSVETRCVFKKDPLGKLDGPMLLYQTRIRSPKNWEKELVCNRWLKKL